MLLVLGGLWIGQNVNLLPVDASVNAPIYDELFRVLFSIGTILFVGIVGLIVFSLVRFRRRPGQLGDGIALEGNLPLEVFWTAVPAIVVLFVGLYSYDIYERMGGMVPLGHGDHGAVSASQCQRQRCRRTHLGRHWFHPRLPDGNGGSHRTATDRGHGDAVRLPLPLPGR